MAQPCILFVLFCLQLTSVWSILITSDAAIVANKNFSYVIVGGGTAGLTIASRLAEDPTVSILVIEAGPDAKDDPNVNDPGLLISALATYNWNYNTTRQQVGGNTLVMQQGKVLGGSSSINGMCWTRGTVDQYNTIEELGNPGWNFDNITSYIKKAERFHLPNPQQVVLGATADPSSHGFAGQVNAGFPQPYEAVPLLERYSSAVQSAIPSIQSNIDFNSGNPNGVGRFQYSITPGNGSTVNPSNNLRSSSATAHIYPFVDTKPNLTILTGHLGASILWEKSKSRQISRANGVSFVATGDPGSAPGPLESVKAREVIVAAGALGSPHFLELSGVGDARILKAAGIPLTVNLPSVGTNLQDQSQGAMNYAVSSNVSESDYSALNMPLSGVPAFLTLEQVLGKQSALIAGQSLIDTIQSRAKTVVASGAFTSESGLQKIFNFQARSIVDFKAPVYEMSFDTAQPPFISQQIFVAMWPLLPQWRGTVHAVSSNPNVRPQVNPMYLTEDFDLFIQGNATRLARKIFQTSPLKDIVTTELAPGFTTVPVNATDAQWQNYVTSTYTPVYHPIGSVPMLPREDGGAVDSEVLVYGTENVRVVDASVIPIQISAHLSATVYGFAEKAADIIRSQKN